MCPVCIASATLFVTSTLLPAALATLLVRSRPSEHNSQEVDSATQPISQQFQTERKCPHA
jgi:hypothetical protein